jgi:uncharacterized membrane protein
MCKEDVSLNVTMVGIYAALTRNNKKFIFFPLLSETWFLLSIFVIIPFFNKGGYLYFTLYSHYFGNSLTEITKTIILHPIMTIKIIFSENNLYYLSKLLAPVSFLPLLKPTILLIMAPFLLRNLLTNSITIEQQCTATLIPFIMIATIYGLKKILAPKISKSYPKTIMTLILIVAS